VKTSEVWSPLVLPGLFVVRNLDLDAGRVPKNIFHEQGSDTSVALTNVALTSLALPGCLISIWAIHPDALGCRGTQLASFAYQAVCFASLATVYAIDPANRTGTGLAISATILSLLSGPAPLTWNHLRFTPSALSGRG